MGVKSFLKSLFTTNSSQKKQTIRTVADDQFQSLQMDFITKKNTHHPYSFLSEKDKKLVQSIHCKTKIHNVNNIKRTKAYLDYYLENKEVHWSFLAHMVSRNGGWNMTDLKGSLLKELLPEDKLQSFFEFLEMANHSIFQDAYPQLLLYEHSKKTGRNLFYLLPYFSVSSFMEPIWNYFINTRNSPLLTVALIINEQQLLQSTILHSSKYKEDVLDSIIFKTQEYLGFTDVLFPYQKKNKIELAGVTIYGFEHAINRINVGKTLYGILFHKIYNGALKFAKTTPHTGSRADFWPNVFTKTSPSPNQHSTLIYSPALSDSWPDYTHSISNVNDWFTSVDLIHPLTTFYIPATYRISSSYKNDLEKLSSIKDIKALFP